MSNADNRDRDGAKLTPYQKRILLVLCDAAEPASAGGYARLICKGKTRETTAGMALVRRGLARRVFGKVYVATHEGYHLGDALRIEDRLGRIPPRGQAG